MISRDLTRRRMIQCVAGPLAAASLLGARSSFAQSDYPSRPVKVLVPYAPGGGADTVSRILFAKLSELFGQQFVIDNRGGGGGTIGAAVVAKAERDGHTILYDATAFSVNTTTCCCCSPRTRK